MRRDAQRSYLLVASFPQNRIESVNSCHFCWPLCWPWWLIGLIGLIALFKRHQAGIPFGKLHYSRWLRSSRMLTLSWQSLGAADHAPLGIVVDGHLKTCQQRDIAKSCKINLCQCIMNFVFYPAQNLTSPDSTMTCTPKCQETLEESNHANATSPNLGPRGFFEMILNCIDMTRVLGAFEAQECRIVAYFISPPHLPPICGSKVLSAVDYMRILKLYPRLHRRNSRFLGLS